MASCSPRLARRAPAAALAALLSLSPAAAALAETSPAETSPDGLWSDLPAFREAALAPPETATVRHRAVVLDPAALDALLALAPAEGSAVGAAPVIVSLPSPDGGFGRFRIEASPIVEPALGARYPEIATYRGVGVDDPAATVRFSVTPLGFHAQVLGPGGRYYVDPRTRRERRHHLVYRGADAVRPAGLDFRCDVHGGLHLPPPAPGPAAAGGTIDLRTYRTAVAATGEYTTFHSNPDPPNVPDGLAAIVVAMNRVNGIYESEVAIRMILVANNDLVVYTNSATDPYTNNNGVVMLGQNQANLDVVIGSANYDIGHVFSTGGGGVANLGVTCQAGFKARGVTGLTSPTGDVFYVDYVAHEMGHQWGANHSFNGSAGACSGGNRNASTAYEPGSGSTIMAYAGICGSQNIQNNSDDYFHGISLDEIVAFSRFGGGNGCAATVAVGNTPPAADAGPGFTIPIGTPFSVCGAGADADGDPLVYDWEEWDLGPAGHPSAPTGDAPIFRSFDPVGAPERTFPRWSDVLGNVQTLGEILPSYGRTLNFRLTVRDAGQVAGTYGSALTQVTVEGGSGPFAVTAPNTAVVWPAGSQQTVTWSPGGTAAPPVGCTHVAIRLSIDGGASFPIGLGGSFPNNGSALVTVPATTTAAARVMVHCATPGASFFDVGNANFTISGAGELVFAASFEGCGGGFGEWSSVLQEP